MSEDLDNLIICENCHTVHKKVDIPNKKIAKCSVCGSKLYSNSKYSFQKAIAFSITALILFILANLFPILKVHIAGNESYLTIPKMVYTLFNEGFYVVGSIVFVVILIAPIVVILSYLLLGLLIKFKLLQPFARHIVVFLINSRNWAMVDIFGVSILVALVKLFGYAKIEFGVSAIALLLFIIIDVAVLKSIKPVELWSYFNRGYDEKR